MVAEANMLLVAHPSLGVGNVRELIALAKARPNAVSAAISPIGTPNHLGVELLAQKADLDMTFVPYPGTTPALNVVLGQQVTSIFGTYPNVTEYLKAGKLRALAVGNGARAKPLPDVPTVAESGYWDFDVDAWFGSFAPANTSARCSTVQCS